MKKLSAKQAQSIRGSFTGILEWKKPRK